MVKTSFKRKREALFNNKKLRPRRDSNPQPFDPKSNALPLRHATIISNLIAMITTFDVSNNACKSFEVDKSFRLRFSRDVHQGKVYIPKTYCVTDQKIPFSK